MKKYWFVLLAYGLFGCIEGGTHGYIKRYRYNTSKSSLEKTVRQVLSETSVIRHNSVKSYYNDDIKYISISILEIGLPYTYVCHYYGGKVYWDTSKTSALSIIYAHDEKENGGSSGNGGISWYDFKLKKKLTSAFEKEFVSKIDKKLGLKHTEE